MSVINRIEYQDEIAGLQRFTTDFIQFAFFNYVPAWFNNLTIAKSWLKSKQFLKRVLTFNYNSIK